MPRRLPDIEDIDLTRSYYVQILVPALYYLKLVQLAKARKVQLKEIVYEAVELLMARK